MNKEINLAKTELAVEQLKQIKYKKPINQDVKFKNVHLLKINKNTRTKIFLKDDLYANTGKLYKIMNEPGFTGQYDYHGISPEEVINILSTIHFSKDVYESYYGRFVILSGVRVIDNLPALVIIETGASLINDRNANINKLVSIYPKDKVDNYLNKFKKK